MASWLKAAEDLFEVVDRRAKLVAGDIADESESSAIHEAISHPKRKSSKPKPRKKLSMDESPNENICKESSEILSDPASDEVPVANDVTASTISEENSAQNHNIDQDSLNIQLHGSLPDKEVTESLEIAGTESQLIKSYIGTLPSFSNINVRESGEVSKTDSGSELSSMGIVKRNNNTDDKLETEAIKVPVNVNSPSKDSLCLTERSVSLNIEEHRAEERDQLEEAQVLCKTANTNGKSKEARLARICNGLSIRLQEYKSENSQLEKLLASERNLNKSYEAHISQLQQDLSLSKVEITRVESSMLEALGAKNAEIETLASAVEILKKKLSDSEGNVVSLQTNMNSIIRNRELTETRMIQALREELSSAERKAEDERAAHSATKMAAREREAELEYRAVEASSALAKIQRIADERTFKAAELEQKVALLEVECGSLNQELQDLEARARHASKKSLEETTQAMQIQQIQAWQEEVERARQIQRDAENKLSFVEAEVQKLRVEMAAMKRDAEHYSRHEHVELEKRYRELTDLLYHKQTQLEAMASEKAAAEFQLEKELKRLHEAQVEAERYKVSRRPSWEEETEMKALESLPLYQRHMVGASVQLQKAVKMLDSGAARATRFLWRYPTARLTLLCYLVFVHLFLMYLLHQLQVQADDYYAKTMDHTNPTLP